MSEERAEQIVNDYFDQLATGPAADASTSTRPVAR